MASAHAVGDGFVAEVTGLNLSEALDDSTIDWIAGRLDDFAVLIFRDQNLDAAALDRFARRYGTPQRHVLQQYRHPDIPEISYVTNVAADGSVDRFGLRRATCWHSDATYEAKLPRLAMLHALEVPSQGGGTYFADLRAAWDTLPAETQVRLLPLTGLHRFNRGPANSAGIYDGQTGVKEAVEELQHHPAAAVHPRSGRRILFVNPAHTVGFDGMDQEEGWKLVEELSAHAAADRFVHRHDWRPGDLVIWDERATMHRGAGDSRPEDRRVLIRAIVY